MGQELVSTERAGAVDTRAQDLGAFPTDAFSFTPPATAVPVLTLKKPWLFSATNVIFKVATSADYTVLDDDGYTDVYVSTGASNRTITLPLLANNQGRVIKIYKTDSGVGEVIIDGNGAETVDRFTTIRVGLQYQTLTIVGASSGWYILSGPLQPVALEPSLGTLHPRTKVNVLAIGASVMGTYKIDCSAVVPVGTKAVWIAGNCNSANTSYHEFMQWGGAYGSIFVLCSAAYGNVAYCGLMMLDSNRWGQVVITNANNLGGVNTAVSGYWI